MESTLVSSRRVNQARNWIYTANSQDVLWIESKLSQSTYPITSLGQHITGLAGGLTPRGAVYPKSGVIFIRVGNIQPHGLDLSDIVYIDEKLHRGELKRCQLKENDVLLAITGATFGKACVVPPGIGEANINQHIVRMRTSPDLNPHYLAIFFNSELGMKQSLSLATGGTRPALDYNAIRSVQLPLPPRPVQDQIVREMQDAYTIRQAKLREAEQLLHGVGRYVLEELNVDCTELNLHRSLVQPIKSIQGGRFDFEAVVTLRDIDFNGIKPIPLGDVAMQINDRILPAEDLPDQEVNYVGLEHIISQTGELTNFAPVQGKTILSSSPQFKSGYILFGRMRPYLNKVWLADFDGVCSGEIIVLKPDESRVDPRFLHALLLSQITLLQVVPLQSGTSLPRVSASDVLSVKLPLPESLNSQVRIGEEVARRQAKARCLRIEAENVILDTKYRVEQMILGEKISV